MLYLTRGSGATRAREDPKPISKDSISTTGYPIGIGGTLVYDSMDHNAKRKATNPNGTDPCVLPPRMKHGHRKAQPEEHAPLAHTRKRLRCRYLTLGGDDDTALQFESLFESANLFQAC